MVFYEASEEDLNSEVAATIKERIWLEQLFDAVRAEVVDLRETFGARNAVIRSIGRDSCSSLEPFLSSLVEKFRAGLNTLVS